MPTIEKCQLTAAWRFVRRHARWSLIVAAGVGVFALGYTGFARHFARTGEPRTIDDLVYLTLQLFVLQSGDVHPISWSLDLARFLAPLVAAYAGFAAILSIFYAHLQMFRPRLLGNHVVVCGLGRRGSKLVEELLEDGYCVVVIESDTENVEAVHCRYLGAIVVIGAANERWALEKACVGRAKYLICVTGDDGANVETAVLAHELAQDRRVGALHCIVHLFDPRLESLLKKHKIFTDQDDPFVLSFFNTFDIGARQMLRKSPVLGSGTPAHENPHLLIVGLGRLGELLLIHAAAEWKARRSDPGAMLRVTVVDRKAELKQNWLPLRYPDLQEVCRIRYIEMDIHLPEFASGRFLEDSQRMSEITSAYICLDHDSAALYAALSLRQCLTDRTVPIVVRMNEQAGLASLMGSDESEEGLIAGVYAVGLRELMCSRDLILAATQQEPLTAGPAA